MIRRALTAFAFFSVSTMVHAAALERAAPESVGMSSKGLADLKAAMTAMVTSGQRAGIVYAVARDGKLVALEAIGKRDMERNLPMEPDTAFRIYSQTRALTAVTALTLVEDGKLSLNDPVSKYIPEAANVKVLKDVKSTETEPLKNPMTVYHLFTYTAGFGYAPNWPKELGFQQRDVTNLDQPLEVGIRNLLKMPLLHQPGAKWYYGFAGDVLGRVMEVAAGQPLNKIMNERLFDRIGMTQTDFWVTPERAARGDLANQYSPGPDGKLVNTTDKVTPLSHFTKPGPFFSGGGGIVSTVPDYLRFAQMLLNEGKIDGVQVLKPETVREMLRRHTTAEQGDVYWYAPDAFPTVKGFGWGLSIGVRPDDAGPEVPGKPGERGWAGLANTLFFINLKERIAGVAMAQYVGANAGALNFSFRDGVYNALAKQ
jgi:CubicO group peptidase (beta-lactamase class C family)